MTDVLIAGAGPTGLMTAAELALAGVEVTVLDRRDGPGLPRPVGLQPRTAELLDLRGLDTSPDLDGPSGHFAGLPVPLDHSVWHTRHPRVLNRTQDDVEAMLAEHAVKHGAVIERGHDVTAVDADEDGVTVDGLRARWLVACDGAHSTVRKLLDVPFPGRSGTFRAVLMDVVLSSVSELVPARAYVGHGCSSRQKEPGGMRVALGAARQGCQVAARMRRVLRWDPRRQRRRIRTIIVMQQLPMALTLAKPRR